MTKYHSARYGPKHPGGYRFKDAGDNRGGVWTEAERLKEAARIEQARKDHKLRTQKEQDNGEES
jgi:hypothetical protein